MLENVSVVKPSAVAICLPCALTSCQGSSSSPTPSRGGRRHSSQADCHPATPRGCGCSPPSPPPPTISPLDPSRPPRLEYGFFARPPFDRPTDISHPE